MNRGETWGRLRGAAFELALAGLCFLLAAFAASLTVSLLALPTAVSLLVSPLATAGAAWAYARSAPLLGGRTLEESPAPRLQTIPQSAATGVVGWVAAIGGSVLIALILKHLIGQEVSEQARIMALFERADPWELSALAVAVVFLAPLGEELLFRAQLFRRLRLWLPLPGALGLSALLFAAVHANASGLLTYVWLALCFTFALLRSGRVGCAIFVHAANNAATFLLLFFDWQS